MNNFSGLIGKKVSGTTIRNSAGITGTVVGAYVSTYGSGTFLSWDNRSELRLIVLNEATGHIEEVNLKECRVLA